MRYHGLLIQTRLYPFNVWQRLRTAIYQSSTAAMPLREVLPEDDRALQSIADSLAKSHKHLLVTGAGISTSCGIPVSPSYDAG